MEDTIIYLIRHAETVNENGIRNTSEDSQLINEKEIISVEDKISNILDPFHGSGTTLVEGKKFNLELFSPKKSNGSTPSIVNTNSLNDLISFILFNSSNKQIFT